MRHYWLYADFNRRDCEYVDGDFILWNMVRRELGE
jgi:hypothetical protein